MTPPRWSPTPAAFAAYQAREVELARVHIARVRAGWLASADLSVGALKTSTLFSWATLRAALGSETSTPEPKPKRSKRGRHQ